MDEMDEMFEIVFVGAGPHTLSCICTLLEKYPMDENLVDAKNGQIRSNYSTKILNKKIMKRDVSYDENELKKHILVIDTYGKWMENWNKKFEFLEIPNLRSNASVHPDPIDPSMLITYANYKKYSIENGFVEIEALKRGKDFKGPFLMPKTNLFKDFCEYLINIYKLEKIIKKGNVKLIEHINDCFKLILDNSNVIYTKTLIISIGHSNIKNIPDWISEESLYPKYTLRHSWDLIHDTYDENSLKNEIIAIIGGGLTSIQLIEKALHLGAKKIYFFCRNYLKVRQFDSDIMWSGTNRFMKLNEFWSEEDMNKRIEMINTARNGGTINIENMKIIEKLINDNFIELKENVEVWDASWIPHDDNHFHLELSDNSILNVNRIWLATGSTLDINQETMFHKLIQEYNLKIFNGYPLLNKNLKWHDELNLFIIGAYASLALGPDGINLAGARRAAFWLKHALVNEFHWL